jgi:hypothetical protein
MKRKSTVDGGNIPNDDELEEDDDILDADGDDSDGIDEYGGDDDDDDDDEDNDLLEDEDGDDPAEDDEPVDEEQLVEEDGILLEKPCIDGKRKKQFEQERDEILMSLPEAYKKRFGEVRIIFSLFAFGRKKCEVMPPTRPLFALRRFF